MSDSEQTAAVPSLQDYLQTSVAPRFAELVRGAEQRQAAAQRELDDLRAASGTMAWEISGAAPARCYVNIAAGVMTVATEPSAEPFMTVSQSADDWVRFTSSMAGLFGGDPRRPLGRSRIERVRAIKGAVRFVLSGLPDGSAWTCTLYFGNAPRPAEPQTTVTMAAELVSQIQAGKLDPQVAFMQ